MRHLLAGLRISSAMSRVENGLTPILCVLIASVQHDRTRAGAATSGNAGNAGAMYPGTYQLGAGGKAASNRVSWKVSDDWL
jgi:hypothetical protein